VCCVCVCCPGENYLDLEADEWQAAPVVEVDREWADELDLAGMHLGMRGSTILAALMPRCGRLTSLSVADNGIDAEAAVHLAKGLLGGSSDRPSPSSSSSP
jgi:hypothetical protein